MRQHPYDKLLGRKRKWSPVKPTVGVLKNGAEDTIRRALSARHLELPVGAFITEGLEKTVPDNARKLLEDNVKDDTSIETRRDSHLVAKGSIKEEKEEVSSHRNKRETTAPEHLKIRFLHGTVGPSPIVLEFFIPISISSKEEVPRKQHSNPNSQI